MPDLTERVAAAFREVPRGRTPRTTWLDIIKAWTDSLRRLRPWPA